MSRYILPRLRDLVFLSIFIGALVSGSRMLNTDGDLGRHLTLGSYILSTHRIPTVDIFSYTKSNQARPPYEWLAEVLFALAYLLLNLDGVVLLTALILAATFVVLYLDASRRSNTSIIALLLTLWAAAASSLHWLTRPHIFTMLCLAVWISWLEEVRRGSKVPVWIFPALMLLWANLHGGFVFGFLAWGAYLAGWLWDFWRKTGTAATGRKFALLGAASLVVSVITPDFWQNWAAVLNNNNVYILSHTAETLPPNFFTPNTWPFAGLLVLTVGLLILCRKQVSVTHVLLVVGFAGLGLIMGRNIPLFALVAAPIVSVLLQRSAAAFSDWLKLEDGFGNIDKGLAGWLWPVLIVLGCAGILTLQQTKSHSTIYRFDPLIFPVQGVDWVENHPIQGRMFNDFNWGGYLLYRLWPTERVFIDSQSDFYGGPLTLISEDIVNGNVNWENELSQYQVNWMIIPESSALAKAARGSVTWTTVYEDRVALILVRK